MESEMNEEETWTPPSSLPPPTEARSGPPVLAILAVAGVAVGAGVALWMSSQVFYIYILYNSLIGAGIGWALGLGPRKAGFTNKAALLGLAVVFCVLPYVLMRYGFYVQTLSAVAEQGQTPDFGFFDFFVFFLERDSLFGLELGLIGNSIILLIEIAISVYYAHNKIEIALQHARIESVPGDVVSFVVNGIASGWDTARVRTELAHRGWARPDDQDRAIGTGFDVIGAIQAQQAG
jgi:hypothetical protein